MIGTSYQRCCLAEACDFLLSLRLCNWHVHTHDSECGMQEGKSCIPVTQPWNRGEAKGLPPTTASLNLSLKEPSPVPAMFS